MEQVQSVVRVLSGLVKDGWWGSDFTSNMTEAVTPEMLSSFDMHPKAGVQRFVRKDIFRAGVDCSPSLLGVRPNYPVGIKCIHEVYVTDSAHQLLRTRSEDAAECRYPQQR